ncbi:MAG TPA: DUF448 domain-containing protein [Verrucomicrobiae bacterium]|nr:DUF448 domain-containing protein [Verrucomicrobiae bacterium]
MSGEARRPHRRCCGCRRRRPQARLLRLRSRPEGVSVDRAGEPRLGRGAYVCARMECWRATQRPGVVARALRIPPAMVDLTGLLEALAARTPAPPPDPADVEDRSSPS